MATCRACGATGDTSGLVHLVTEGTRCYACFDAYVRSQSGESPLRAAFPAIVVTDVNGMPHVFELRATLSSEGHELEAAEVVAYPRTGYRFAVVGPTTATNMALFIQLHATLRQALGRRHVELTDFGWQLTADRVEDRSGMLFSHCGAREVSEAELSDTISFSTPADRLLALYVDDRDDARFGDSEARRREMEAKVLAAVPAGRRDRDDFNNMVGTPAGRRDAPSAGGSRWRQRRKRGSRRTT